MLPVIIVAGVGAYVLWQRKKNLEEQPSRERHSADEIINGLQNSLLSLGQKMRAMEGAEQLPPLRSIVVTLQLSQSSAVGGGASLSVVSGHAEKSQQQTHSITVRLAPPTPEEIEHQPPQGGPRVPKKVAHVGDAIITAVGGILKATRKSEAARIAGFTVDLSFTLGKNAQATVSGPIGQSLTGSLNRSTSTQKAHRIVLEFSH